MKKGADCVPPFENLYMIKRELKHGKRVYSMEYHFMKSAKGKNSYWDDDTHSMQLSFGVDEFLVFFCFALYKHRPSYDSVGFIYYYFNHFCVFLAFSP